MHTYLSAHPTLSFSAPSVLQLSLKEVYRRQIAEQVIGIFASLEGSKLCSAGKEKSAWNEKDMGLEASGMTPSSMRALTRRYHLPLACAGALRPQAALCGRDELRVEAAHEYAAPGQHLNPTLSESWMR